LPAPTMGHLIGMIALVSLIFILPIFYFSIVDNVTIEMKERELKEVADYVSNSLWNLHVLANSTNSDVLVTKKLDLPSSIRGSTYFVEIVPDQEGSVQYVAAYMNVSSVVNATSLVFPGLKANKLTGYLVEGSENFVVAGCNFNNTGSYVWIKEEPSLVS
jgi:hypothetical protein